MRPALPPEKVVAVYDRAARRYDRQHALLTLGSDRRGRRLVVQQAVSPGMRVLDAGGGTGSTALLAAEAVGPSGRVILLDLTPAMLRVARRRAARQHLEARITPVIGDMLRLPFVGGAFDAVLSTYSACPLYDPVAGMRELYRVLRPGGRLGVAHSAEPEHPLVRRLAAMVEAVIWRFPALSLGCRPVETLPALVQSGAILRFRKHIGVPLWPFLVYVVEKPVT